MVSLRIFVCLLVFPGFAFSQQVAIPDIVFYWPVVGANSTVEVDLINSNFGDYRSATRFHNGTDVQATTINGNPADGTIQPITEFSEVRAYIETDPGSEVYLAVLQHGRFINGQFEVFPNSYSVYLHLEEDIDQDLLNMTGEVITRAQILASARQFEMQDNHLHFFYATDLNGTTSSDVNDDAAVNPLKFIDWSNLVQNEVVPRDNTIPEYPKLRNIYIDLRQIGTVTELSYPNSDAQLKIHSGDPTLGFYRLEYYVNGEQTNDYLKPRLLLNNISAQSRLPIILQATDEWNDTGLTPNEIKLFIDQHEENAPIFNEAYFSVAFDEIETGQPHSSIVYNITDPLPTQAFTSQQYYRLHRNPTNNDVLPGQVVNDPIDLYVGEYSEEGMHKAEVVIRSDRYYDFTAPPPSYRQNTSKGIFYYYLMNNSETYVDFADSGYRL